jgi:hypothetical protein
MAPRKEACIFLIDSSITMEDHIDLACDTVSSMIQHRIMQGASNEVGLMLFGECTFSFNALFCCLSRFSFKIEHVSHVQLQ